MKACFILLTCLMVLMPDGASGQEYSAQVRQWPQMTLRLTPEMPVSDIFDSGFRPYRLPVEGVIGFRHARVTITTRQGVSTPVFLMERAEVKVRPAGLIYEMDLYTPPLTISEARSEMTPWLRFGKGTAEDMEAYLAAARADWLHYEINGSKRTSFGNAWTDSDGVTYGVRFMPAYHWEPPVRMVFRIVASRLKSRQRLGVPEPVTPPPGYEHVSMDTPLEWGPDQQYVPVTTERRSPPGTPPPGLGPPASAAQDQQPPEKPGPAEKPIQPAAPYSVPLWRWIILTAFAIGLLWKLLRKPS